jgi:SnoaL-like domain
MTTVMDPSAELAAAAACERLVYDFCHLVDSGRRGEVTALFADQGCWRSGDGVVSGRAALAGYFGHPRANGLLTRHLVANVRISLAGPGQADGHSLVLWFSVPSDSPELPASATAVATGPCQVRLGEFRDRFTYTPEGWRFLDRERRYLLLETPR